MANEEQLSILKQGVEVWNQWRDKNPDIDINLIRANLKEVNLLGANLSGAELRFADLRLSDLGQADLRSAELRGTELNEKFPKSSYEVVV